MVLIESSKLNCVVHKQLWNECLWLDPDTCERQDNWCTSTNEVLSLHSIQNISRVFRNTQQYLQRWDIVVPGKTKGVIDGVHSVRSQGTLYFSKQKFETLLNINFGVKPLTALGNTHAYSQQNTRTFKFKTSIKLWICSTAKNNNQ